MDKERFFELHEQLQASGRLQEILNADGKIVPSDKALREVARDRTSESDAECWRLAQDRTLMDLADKYQSELN